MAKRKISLSDRIYALIGKVTSPRAKENKPSRAEGFSRGSFKDVGGTHFQHELRTSYSKLKRILGEPLTSAHQSYFMWILKDQSTGKTVTIYDVEELYDEKKSPSQARKLKSAPSYRWHVGAESSTDATRFTNWFKRQ